MLHVTSCNLNYFWAIYVFFVDCDVIVYVIVYRLVQPSYVKCHSLLKSTIARNKSYKTAKTVRHKEGKRFPNKVWTLNGLRNLLRKIDATGDVEDHSGSGRPRTTCVPGVIDSV